MQCILTCNSAFIGCWVSDPCNYYFGRRGVRNPLQQIEMRESANEDADHIYQRYLLLVNTYRFGAYTDMGATIHRSSAHGNRNGPQGLKCAYLRRRELSS